MAARAIWKGVLSFDSVSVPVKLYSAIVDRDVHFHLLHDQDMVRVEQRMVSSATNKEIDREHTQRGVEISPGEFVVLSDEELQSTQPEPSRDIAIDRFVPRGHIGDQF